MIHAPGFRRLVLNLGSSYAHIGLMAAITLFLVPIYVKALGTAQWGLVALCITVQGVLYAIDVALAPLMLRDVARARRLGTAPRVYARFLRLYASIALGLFVLGQILVTFLQLAPAAAPALAADLVWPMRILLLQFLFQFCNNAAIGYWNGLERQGFANLRSAAFTLAKHGLALCLVILWEASAILYLAPFAIVAAIEFLLNHRSLIRWDRQSSAHPRDGAYTETARADDAGMTLRWRAIGAFGLAAGLGVFGAQIDRVFLSLTLSPEQYGIYFLVGSLPLSLLHLQVPIQRAFLPRIATAAAPWRAATAMLKVSMLLLVLPSLVLALFPQWTLWLWLHDADIAATGAAPLRLILIAVALMAIYAPIGALLLSQHRYRALALINGSVLATQLLLLFALTPRLGMTAGGLAWLGCGLMQMLWAAVLYARLRAASPVAGGARA